LGEIEYEKRGYWDMYGDSAGMLLGASGATITNFEKATVGVAPQIAMKKNRIYE
jgi:hypothetical protein